MTWFLSEKNSPHESYRSFRCKSDHFDTGAAWCAELDSDRMGETRTSSDDGASKTLAVFVVLLAVGLSLAITLAWLGRIILLLLFAAIVVAVFLTAIVDWIKPKLKLNHGLALALILFTASALALFTLWISGPNIIEQFAKLQTELPQAAQNLIERVKGQSWGRWLLAQWSGYSQLADSFSYALTRIGGIVVSTATLLAGLIIVAFLGLYLAAEPEVYFSGIRRATPRRYRDTLDACAVSAVRNLRWWLLAQTLSMAAVGILVTLGLWALGVPLAGTLGIIAALMTFIPNVGPILSVAPAALLAVAISPGKGLLTVLLFVLVHFLEGNIITPLLQRQIVRLPPALTLTVQLLLAVVAGPLGVALAAPITAAALGVFKVLLPADAIPTTSVVTGPLPLPRPMAAV
jgi:predicted PurR-regulated permease PerM